MEYVTRDARVQSWMKHLHPGEILFREGETGQTLFILAEGQLEISRHGAALTTIDGAGMVIGEIAALTNQIRTATVRALTPCRLVAVADVDELCTLIPGWGIQLARLLAIRLRRIETELDKTRAQANRLNHAETAQLLAEMVNSLASAMQPEAPDTTPQPR